MKSWKIIGALLVLFLTLVPAHAKGKKQPEVSALFANARYVYVQAEDGDLMKPGLYPEDRDAISNVQQALREWNRYAITTERDSADLVFIVRQGTPARVAGASRDLRRHTGPSRQSAAGTTIAPDRQLGGSGSRH